MVYILFYTRNLIPSMAGLFVREFASAVSVGVCGCLFTRDVAYDTVAQKGNAKVALSHDRDTCPELNIIPLPIVRPLSRLNIYYVYLCSVLFKPRL